GWGRLAGRPSGSYVNLTLSVGRSAARHVHAHGPPVSGIVRAVDVGNKTITVDDRTFTVAPDAVVLIDGQRGQLAGVSAGANVNLRLRGGQQTVGFFPTKEPSGSPWALRVMSRTPPRPPGRSPEGAGVLNPRTLSLSF